MKSIYIQILEQFCTANHVKLSAVTSESIEVKTISCGTPFCLELKVQGNGFNLKLQQKDAKGTDTCHLENIEDAKNAILSFAVLP